MAYTRTWDETAPAGSSDADLIDDFIRNYKTDVRERIAALFGMDLTQFSADPIEPQGLDWSLVSALKFVGPSTSTTWRNNANSADNMMLDDLGNLSIRKDIKVVGGMTQAIDGWSQSNIPASQAATEPTRAAGRWIAPRAGSLLGILLQVGAGTLVTAGTLTAKAWKSVVGTGTSTHTDAVTTLTATLGGLNTVLDNQSSTKDSLTFAANDELFVKFDTSSLWAPTTLTVRAALLVEF